MGSGYVVQNSFYKTVLYAKDGLNYGNPAGGVNTEKLSVDIPANHFQKMGNNVRIITQLFVQGAGLSRAIDIMLEPLGAGAGIMQYTFPDGVTGDGGYLIYSDIIRTIDLAGSLTREVDMFSVMSSDFGNTNQFMAYNNNDMNSLSVAIPISFNVAGSLANGIVIDKVIIFSESMSS
jgi:hypothetical protein